MLTACQSSRPWQLFGYRLGADALYDSNIRTVYVPVFANRALQTTPYRGFEVDLTQAVIREIGRTTSFRVVSDPERADTELIGVIVAIQKQILNRTQQNMVRDGDLIVTVDVLWRDLRTGAVLSAPRKSGATPPVLPGDVLPVPGPFDPTLPPPAPPPDAPQAIPTRLVAAGRYLPELGETSSSAAKRVQDQLAVQIVSMMERPW
ncbi:MAG: LPS assembly lipoprotein LptE [Gemmataceae bacterium]|nr:LPS assembly lipoprotein LptE [Gemmataceae bacterium]